MQRGIPAPMNTEIPRSRLDRAARLHREALNCLTLAVRERADQFAAELIDEAVRLMRRSAELAQT